MRRLGLLLPLLCTAALAATAQASTASGCGGSSTLSLKIGGRERTVIVHVPHNAAARRPLVLDLHGSGSTASRQEGFSGLDATADAHGFVVAYPQGLIPDGSGFDWNIPGVPLFGGRAVPKGAADDVAFLKQLAGVLERRDCVDPKRIYATGFSGGARLSSQLACDAAGTFAAVAPVSGLRDPTPCPATRAVSIVSFHGTADPVDPYAGHGQSYWTYSVPAALSGWSKRDGCSAHAVTQPAKTVTLTRYTGCRDGAVVELSTIAGEGHEWPGGPRLPRAYTAFLGPQSSAVDANEAIWRVFEAARRP